MKPWIQNVSFADIQKGRHFDAGFNSMLIQIVDPDMEFPVPMYHFRETYQFKFLDIEDDGMSNDGNGNPIDMSWGMITDEQAVELVRLLKRAEDEHMNVVVHCVAGVCRSGAVCEVGVMMGFRDTEVFRSPNLLVKHKMMKSLGWTYDEDEPHTINGYTTESGIILPKAIDWANDNEKVFTLAAERRERRQREGDI
jgi:predicted protein tyrosine phosphatase